MANIPEHTYLVQTNSTYHQRIHTAALIDGKVIQTIIELQYASIAGKWFMSLLTATGDYILRNIPLVLAQDISTMDLLKQFQYIEQGSMFVYQSTDNPETALPQQKNLAIGSDYQLVWSDSLD